MPTLLPKAHLPPIAASAPSHRQPFGYPGCDSAAVGGMWRTISVGWRAISLMAESSLFLGFDVMMSLVVAAFPGLFPGLPEAIENRWLHYAAEWRQLTDETEAKKHDQSH